MTIKELEPYLKKFVVITTKSKEHSGLVDRIQEKEAGDGWLILTNGKPAGSGMIVHEVHHRVSEISAIRLQ